MALDPTLPRFNPNEQAAVVPFFFMHEGEECVKVQIAGETRFSPVFRAHDMYERDGLQEITYAERWPDQYAQFKSGETQIADGTALTEVPFLNQSRIADLRQIKIYTIEALASIDDRNIARLGGEGYKLKAMAKEWLATRMQRGSDGKIAELQAKVEALTAMLQQPDHHFEPPAEADGESTRLKEEIKAKTGSYPRGNPGIDTLRRILSEIDVE